MTRTHFLRLALAALAALPATGAPAQERDSGRLYYQLEVTNAGSRSQGWHGTLFGADGAPLVAAPDARVTTPLGVFRNHPCSLPWEPCGFLREDTPPAPAPDTPAALIDSAPWRYQLTVTAEGSRSEGWRGALWHGDEALPPEAAAGPVWTPFGRLVPLADDGLPWGWSGWRPEGWGS